MLGGNAFREVQLHCHGGVKVVGLRRGARGKCTHRVANRIGKLPKIEISVGKCLERNRNLKVKVNRDFKKKVTQKSRDFNRKVIRK